MDNGFGQFRTFLQYKLEEQGKYLATVDKWYPSSKLRYGLDDHDHPVSPVKREK